MRRGLDVPVTFVFEAEGTSSGLNKSAINAHIARQAHRRRREKRFNIRTEGLSNDNRHNVKNQAQWVSPTRSYSHTKDYDSNYDSSIPSPVKLAGNSDPFSSRAIAVTAQVNRLLVFTRDFILPATHANEASVTGGRLHMDLFWGDTIRGLDDDGGVAGYAYLARSASILSTLTPWHCLSVMALQYLGKATSNLRKSIVMHSSSSSTSQADAWGVYALFCAEIAGGNLPAAAVHGMMLRCLIQPDGRTLYVERRLLMVVLQQDMTRACLSLTRPSFDLHRWAREHLPTRITDDLIDSVKDGKSENHDHPHPSAFPFSSANLSSSLSPALRSVFLGVREWLDALGIVMLNRGLLNLALLINGAMKIMVLEGHLLNLYLDRMDECRALAPQSPPAAALVEARMALAALYWVRRAAHEQLDAGSKLEEAGSWAFDMSCVVAVKLRDLDLRILQLESSSSSPSYPAETHHIRSLDQDRLWCLYVGTMAECNIRAQDRDGRGQVQTPPPAAGEQVGGDSNGYHKQYHHHDQSYHGTQLVQLVATFTTTEIHLPRSWAKGGAGPWAWSKMEPVLHRYLHIDKISLKAKRWFMNQCTATLLSYDVTIKNQQFWRQRREADFNEALPKGSQALVNAISGGPDICR
ncbi:hypothetical protein PV08_08605 [Exophiala spinifera]|uniref:Transcription factor domain-containing protein n=1 Tax=Exophiala spinifera TaxID=91928 RepID=A0A0D1ZKQ9_9EURO|nr:uncharacterized protein PV08_08605 [Exophiala spinifera]KIW13417.1 hypothetical protein PV08_08605 [Exophiala spinifera]